MVTSQDFPSILRNEFVKLEKADDSQSGSFVKRYPAKKSLEMLESG